MNFKNFSFLIAGVVLAGASAVYAAAPSGGYAPNATLNPDCAPGDVDCFVTALGSAWDNSDGSVANGTGNINYTEGRVSIGTAVASGQFNILSSSSVDGIPNIFLNDRDGNSAAISAWGNGLGFWDAAADASAANAPDMYIASPGYVGIGTTSPGQPLHVDGTALVLQTLTNRSDDGLIRNHFIMQRTGEATVSPVGTTQFALGTQGDGSGNVNKLHTTYFNGAVTTPYFTMLTNGNVGIGATDPDTKLEVAGLVKLQNDAATACDGTTEGSIRYNGATNKHQGCDGTTWNDLY